MLTKEELLQAIQQSDKEVLSNFLFDEDDNQYVLISKSFVTQEKINTVWLGDFLREHLEEETISPQNLKMILNLTDQKGNRWLDYVCQQESYLCRGAIDCLIYLAKKNILSYQEVFDYFFEQTPDGWNFATLIAKYQSPETVKHFIDIIYKMGLNKLINAKDLLMALSRKMEKNWTFIHCLASTDNFNFFLLILQLWLSHKLITGEELLNFLSMKTDEDVTAAQLTKSMLNLDKLLSILELIYKESSNHCYQIFDLLGHKGPRKAIIETHLTDLLIRRNKISVLNYLRVIFDHPDADRYFAAFIEMFVANVDCISLLIRGKNNIAYKLIIEKLEHYLKMGTRSEGLPINTISLFFNTNGEGINHLMLLIKQNESLPMENIHEILKILTIRYFNHLQPSLLEGLLAGKEGWTALHLAAKYYQENDFLAFVEFLKSSFDKNDEFLKNVSYEIENEVSFTSSEESLSELSEDITDNAENKCSTLATYLKKILPFNETEPSIVFLLHHQSSTNFRYFLTYIKKETLNNRTLRFLLLNAFIGDIASIKKKLQPDDFNWLINYLSEHILKFQYDLDNLAECEQNIIKNFAKCRNPGATYLLSKLTHDKEEKERCFNLAIKQTYPPALLEKSLHEIKSWPLKVAPSFITLGNHLSEQNLVTFMISRRRFFSEPDYLLLLKKTLNYLQQKEAIYFQIAHVFYQTRNFTETTNFLNKISSDQVVLEANEHREISIIYSHIGKMTTNLVHDYYSIKHWQLFNPIMTEELMVDYPEAIVLWLQLENCLKTDECPEIRNFAQTLRQELIQAINKKQVNADQMTNVLKMMHGWLKTDDLHETEIQFHNYCRQNKKKSYMFPFYSSPSPLVHLIEQFYGLLISNKIQIQLH